MTLVERVAEWPKQWLREGREQGLAEGREQGREQGLERGLERGLEQGREQGLDQQRALLCRLAAARFGADTAARLAAVLAPIADLKNGWARSVKMAGALRHFAVALVLVLTATGLWAASPS